MTTQTHPQTSPAERDGLRPLTTSEGLRSLTTTEIKVVAGGGITKKTDKASASFFKND